MRLTLLLLSTCLALAFSNCNAATPKYRQVDDRRVGQVGIRKIVGRHLWLYTDLPASNAVDELPLVFDKAVEQWADYFGIPPLRVAHWQMQGFLMQDRAKFAALNLLPETKSDFVNGYAQGYELWLNEQPSEYYRRHLLLHEGTHGFMHAFLGAAGPGWYSEGMAELLGTHRWKDAQLQLGYMPSDRKQVPMWGRIKLIRDANQNGEPLELEAVLGLGQRTALTTDQYAWCWALCKFLDTHPHWQTKFRQLKLHVAERDFNQRFLETFDRAMLQTEWNAFVAALDYGYEPEHMAMVHKATRIVGRQDAVTIAADRGWQATGWQLEGGKQYTITAEGRYQIAFDQGPWPCEPGGVTLRYHAGHPLGMLLGAIHSPVDNAFSKPLALGTERTFEAERDGQLYLRVNDSPAQLSDNQGSLQATIAPKAENR